jgi:hypothetical protein
MSEKRSCEFKFIKEAEVYQISSLLETFNHPLIWCAYRPVGHHLLH